MLFHLRVRIKFCSLQYSTLLASPTPCPLQNYKAANHCQFVTIQLFTIENKCCQKLSIFLAPCNFLQHANRTFILKVIYLKRLKPSCTNQKIMALKVAYLFCVLISAPVFSHESLYVCVCVVLTIIKKSDTILTLCRKHLVPQGWNFQ